MFHSLFCLFGLPLQDKWSKEWHEGQSNQNFMYMYGNYGYLSYHEFCDELSFVDGHKSDYKF